MSANTEMIECWNVRAGAAWLAVHDEMDRMLAGPGARTLAALRLSGGERVLDIGCGCGATTLGLARAVGERGEVTGIDVSKPMLDRAAERAREAGLSDRISWRREDAQTAELEPTSYHAVFSRFGVMFFDHPEAAFASFARATRDSGQLAFVSWQPRDANPWFDAAARASARYLEPVDPARDDEPGPFGLATRDHIHRVLVAGGWHQIEIDAHADPLWLGANVEEATALLTTVGPVGAALRQPEVSESMRDRVLAAVRDALAAFGTPDGVRAPSASWLVTAQR